MSIRKRLIILAGVLIFIILFVPIPQHVHRSYQGIHHTENREEQATAILDIWRFDFLLFGHITNGTIEISVGGAKQSYSIEKNGETFFSYEGKTYELIQFRSFDTATRMPLFLLHGYADSALQNAVLQLESQKEWYALAEENLSPANQTEVTWHKLQSFFAGL